MTIAAIPAAVRSGLHIEHLEIHATLGMNMEALAQQGIANMRAYEWTQR